VKEEMEDPTSTNISDVELLVNLTKDETIQKFRKIRELGKKTMQEERTSLGCIIVVVGFMLVKVNQLKQLGAPLENKEIHH